ncbi:MAG: modification methylase [Spirochaetaceae bacterium]|jgi:DNA modification methylase|nr:modification methylase [Spirochaetaceae bacterium]
MKYTVERNEKYDYRGQSYSSLYPNLHRYPATMLPQIGIDVLKECNISSGALLDPYCGSGTSFMCGLVCGIQTMDGFDINPLAVLISKAKFTTLSLPLIEKSRDKLREDVFTVLKDEDAVEAIQPPKITNIAYWFSKEVIKNLNVLKHSIDALDNRAVRTLFYVPFSETVRDCSYTRTNEFKLYRIKAEDMLDFNPDVIGLFFKRLRDVITDYKTFYLPHLTDKTTIVVQDKVFEGIKDKYDAVLTSPPYGDSRTTVAYGQFSTLSNEWLGISHARKIDARLMGGKKRAEIMRTGCIAEPIYEIQQQNDTRAREVSAFYFDLETSIQHVAYSIKPGGKSIYVVGNRKVKNTELPTDQFIAEKFEENGFTHLTTYKRVLSSKAMPSKNSPTNEAGKTVNTMLYEYIVICEKI